MIPRLNKNAVCITTHKNYILGAVISSYFNDTDTYFSIFNLPDVKEEDSHLLVSKIVANRHSIHITNAIKKLEPKKVILAGLTDYQKSLFDIIPKEYIVEISDINDIDIKIKGNFVGEIICKENDLLFGLYNAKKTKKLLRIDNESSDIEIDQLGGEGLIVIEQNKDINDIVAINYAISINSDIKVIPAFKKTEVQEISKELTEFNLIKNGKLYKKHRQKFKKRIINKLGDLNIKNYSFITFFTQGIPYGYGLGNIIPMTHVLRWTSSYFIFDNIFNEENKDFFYSSIIFSPETFNTEETGYVVNIFKKNNYYVKPIIKNNATVNNFDNYIGHFPYDVLHICSHGGEVSGYHLIQKFLDREGAEHTLECYEIVNFSPDDDVDKNNERLIKVCSKYIFQKFDGFEWMSSELEKQKIPRYVWEDFQTAMTEHKFLEDKTIRTPVKYTIPTSCHVQCIDNIHQCQFHYLAGQTAPFVFNNSCSSWYHIAYSLLGVGARGYIGTLWNIGNETAKQSAELFYNEVFSGNDIISSFFKMNKSIANNKYKNIYIYWGLHFSRINTSNKKSNIKMQRHLDHLLFSMLKKVKDPDSDEDVKKNSFSISKFLLYALLIDLDMKIKETNEIKKFINKNENRYSEERNNDISNKRIIAQ